MKKLFTISDGRSVLVEEEGKVYALVDWDKEEWTYCDASGRPLPDYQPPERGESIYDGQNTEDKTRITSIINGFYGYSTHKVTYFPGGMDGLFGIKAEDGRKVTGEIFRELTHYSFGLCPVRNAKEKWGCVDETGSLVLPYIYSEPPQFNRYGVAVGDNTLIDRNGEPIPGTELDLIEWCDWEERYYCFGMLSESQKESIDQCGSADDVRIDVYDTKLRKYVVRGIPQCRLKVFLEGEGEVIVAAAKLLDEYDSVWVEKKGTIGAEKGDTVTMYDYYLDEES